MKVYKTISSRGSFPTLDPFLWAYSIAKRIHPSIKAWFNNLLCQVPFQVMGNENAQDSGLEELTINVDHVPTGNRTWHKISKERSSLQLWYAKWISWWDQWWRLDTLVQEWQISLLYSYVTYTHLVMAVWNTVMRMALSRRSGGGRESGGWLVMSVTSEEWESGCTCLRSLVQWKDNGPMGRDSDFLSLTVYLKQVSCFPSLGFRNL